MITEKIHGNGNVVHALTGLARAALRNRIIQASVVKALSGDHRSLRTEAGGLLSSVILKMHLVGQEPGPLASSGSFLETPLPKPHPKPTDSEAGVGMENSTLCITKPSR